MCERCNQVCEAPDWRYMLSAQVQDHTEESWVTAFNEAGEWPSTINPQPSPSTLTLNPPPSSLTLNPQPSS